ncbi:MAG TPA: VanZ family protein [Dongiaceae bacterium]|jgi:VanZ family protein|nr:VanZ family protein [Dongiaceae bacterium]
MTPLARRLLRTAFYLASAAVGALSLTPSAALPPVSIGDKAEHVIAYAALGLLGAISSERGMSRTILGLAAFGLLLELLQAFSPGRSPDAIDALADIIGASLGAGLAVVLKHATPTAIDKIAAGATRCRACVAGGNASPTSDAATATSSPPSKRASCVSN